MNNLAFEKKNNLKNLNVHVFICNVGGKGF